MISGDFKSFTYDTGEGKVSVVPLFFWTLKLSGSLEFQFFPLTMVPLLVIDEVKGGGDYIRCQKQKQPRLLKTYYSQY